MFANFYKVALRKFTKLSTYTLTNVFGLAIGIVSSIIIFLYVDRETGYDQFHENADRIYRVGVTGVIAENRLNHAVTPPPLAKTLISEVEEIEQVTRISRFGAWLVRYRDVQFNEDNIIFSDSSFFKVFSFPLILGNPSDVLSKPRSIVISQSTAERYFQDENPMGKLLRIENDSTYYEVTGVMKDVPANSHIHFDMVASLATFPELQFEDIWLANYMYTYFLAKEKVPVSVLSDKVDFLAEKYVLPDYLNLLQIDMQDSVINNFSFDFVLQPIRKIHLTSSFEIEFEPNGNILIVYLFSGLAIIILIVSCLNFVNLATARVANRAKEVSIRKIAGSGRKILIRQFLAESSLLAILSLVLALLITELILPAINQYIGLDLSLSQLINAAGVLLLIVIIIGIGILSGLYPALYLSSFEPVKVMRAWWNQSSDHSIFRRLLVFFQFFVAIGLVAMTLIIFKQYRFMVNKDLGIDKENLLVIRRPDGLKDQLEAYKEKVIQYEGVVSFTNSTFIPGNDAFPRIPFYIEGEDATRNYSLDYIFVSEAFAETYGIQNAQGRFFNEDSPGDTAACVLNETAVNMMGLSDPIGKQLVSFSGIEARNTYEIIGVIEDVHFETLENQVRPMILMLIPGNYEGYLTVKLDRTDQDSIVRKIQSEWEQITTAYPFVSFYLDRSLERNYQPIKEAGRIFLVVSITAILIASLGFYSLINHTYSQRKFEFGIRKVLGASIQRMFLLQIKEVLILVMYSSVIAWTGVFFLARIWLNDIYYHINLNPLEFIIPSFTILTVAILTSGFQIYATAGINPGYALRYQ